MRDACELLAERMGVADLLVLERSGDSLRLLGGAGRGASWAGGVESSLAEEPLAQRALRSGRAVRVSGDAPTRVVGPYWSTHAWLLAVGDEHLVVAGSPGPVKLAGGELVRHATEAVSAIDGVPSAKLLADELEVVHAVRQLMDHRAESVATTAHHIAEVAASALSCEVAAVLVRTTSGQVVETASGGAESTDPRFCADLVALSRRVRDQALLEQDVSARGPLGRDGGLVARYALAIGGPEQLGALVVGHARTRPRGFTSLCQRVGRALADAAEVLLQQAIAREELATERDRFAREARTDPLTGLANRIAWDEAIATERTRRSRYRRPLVVMTADVDNLKAINDAYGHAAGDELLLAAAGVLRGTLRSADLVARIGGDEFGILLPETDPMVVGLLVERIAEGCAIWRGSHPDVHLSLSIGWAAPEPFGDLREALREADERMYAAKRSR